MEIKCPSCSTKHRSEDYPDAFEIQCSCGYSILVPDLDAENFDEKNENLNLDSEPVAMEAEDVRLSVAVENMEDPPVEETPQFPVSDVLVMTPPEELPTEMPYDPFELPQVEGVPSLNEASADMESPLTFQQLEELTNPLAESDHLQAQQEESLAPKEPTQNSVITNPAQAIIQRAQLAGVGQLLGFSYDLEIFGLDAKELEFVLSKCQDLVTLRPWLAAELEKRKIKLNRIVSEQKLSNVPELLALEVFMISLEQGGRCAFTRSETPQEFELP